MIVLQKGHSVNRQDVQNDATAKAFYAMEGMIFHFLSPFCLISGFEYLVTPQEACRAMNPKLPRASCEELTLAFDWEAAMAIDSTVLVDGIRMMHIIETNKDGTIFKKYPDSPKLGPYRVLKQWLGSPPYAALSKLSQHQSSDLQV